MTQIIDIPQKNLFAKIVINSNISIETGLHIGGGGENLDIGGLDKPVVRDPMTKSPYLPGSSIKGKLRSILERYLNKPLNRGGGGVYRYESDDIEDGYTEIRKDTFIAFMGAKTCPLSRIFGSTGSNCWIKEDVANNQKLELDYIHKTTKDINGEPHVNIKGRNHSARLIVRDAHLTTKSVEKLKDIDTGLYMTEWKFENTIDRVTAAANPRQFERVPAGSIFNFEMVYTVEDKSQVIEDLENLAIALKILEDDALGGHGSRGYGKVRFTDFEFYYRSPDYYRNIITKNKTPQLPLSDIKDTDDFLQEFQKVKALLSDVSE